MSTRIPDIYFMVSGSSEGFMPLNAFDNSLMAGGIGDVNLVRLSSILPPSCKQVDPFGLPYGSLVPTAYAAISSSTPGEIISAAVAIAIPEDPTLPGLIMEHSGLGPKEAVEQCVREMAEAGFRRRERALKEIKSISTQHTVVKHGNALAAVVLWYS